jgi:O-antigen/teichoic acid export membrane protein
MLVRNITSNYIGTTLVGFINIFSLSLYVKYFGLEHWGQVATYIAILNTLMVLELGISQIYIAQLHKSNSQKELFGKFQAALIAMAVTGIVVTLAGFFLIYLIKGNLPESYQNWHLLFLALFLFGFNLINNFYYTNLTANERQIEQNVRWVFFVFLKNSIALGMVILVSNKPEIYFISFLLVTAIEIFVNSKTVNNKLFDPIYWTSVISVVKQCGALSLAIALGTLVFNLDRLILPLIIDSKTFGVYAVVVTLGLYFLQLQYPITKALFPFVAKKMHFENTESSRLMWRQVTLLSVLISPILMLAAIFSDQILKFYSIPEDLLSQATWLFNGILLSVLINAAYHGIYMRLVIEDRNRIVIGINIITLLLALIVLMIFGPTAPFFAGMIIWVGVSSVQLIGGVSFYWSKRRYARK